MAYKIVDDEEERIKKPFRHGGLPLKGEGREAESVLRRLGCPMGGIHEVPQLRALPDPRPAIERKGALS